jgi:hypothetical protein
MDTVPSSTCQQAQVLQQQVQMKHMQQHQVMMAQTQQQQTLMGALKCRKAAERSKYSYEDLMRDLGSELENWQREREKKKGKRAEGVADVLEDVAEEFLEFLEMGAGLLDVDCKSGGKPGGEGGSAQQGGRSSSSTESTRAGTSHYSSSSITGASACRRATTHMQ